MKMMPLTWNLERLKEWGDKSGIPFQGTPQSKNTVPYDGRSVCLRCGTCDICPTGARYSPDFTFKRLLAQKKITLHDNTLIRKLALDDAKPVVVAAHGVNRDRPGDPEEYRAKTFVVAAGYTWSSHLLLLSANSRFPQGLANRSGQVGKYMNGHAFIQAFVELDAEIYPNMNPQYGLISRQFFRCSPGDPYVRHDLRIWAAARPGPQLKDAGGRLQLGDDIVNQWRSKKDRGMARVRAYYDVHPAENSELVLDSSLEETSGAIRCRGSRTGPMRPARLVTSRPSSTFTTFSSAWRRTITGKIMRGPKAITAIIRPVAAAWGRTPRQASATVSAARTITTICSWSAHRRSRPPGAPTVR